MTAGFHSPMPPARTGVADYSAALFEAMRLQGDVRLGADSAGVHLYHLGNNLLHREIYRRALDRPGVAVLHDAVLQHFFLGTLEETGYCDEFVFNYGEWLRPLAKSLYRDRKRSSASERYFRYPMLKRIAEHSLGVVVHNAGAQRMVLAHCPAARVIRIPHLWIAPEPHAGWEVTRFRSQLGFVGGECIFGIFGHLRESKRILSVIRAMERARFQGAAAGLVIAGECVSRDLARALDAYTEALFWVKRFPYLEERKFHLLAEAIDVCVNLRYPCAGETSGIAIRLMGLGKPVILSRCEENAGFPEGACLQVDPGISEVRMLGEVIAWMAANPGARRAMGTRAARHIRTQHAAATVASSYWRCLQEAARAAEPAGLAIN